MKRTYARRALLIALSFALLAGCTDGKAIKNEAMKAVNKQAAWTSLAFKGSAELDVSLPTEGQSFLVAGLIGMIGHSRWEWEGSTASKPAQMEGELQILPQGNDKPYSLPFMLKDNKMYMHLPLVMQEDQYVTMDLPASIDGNHAKKPVSSPLTRLNEHFTASLVNSMNAGAFDKQHAGAPKGWSLISVQLQPKNAKEIGAAFRKALSAWLGDLASAGWISEQQAQKLRPRLEKSDWLNEVEIGKNSSLILTLDNKGEIRSEAIDLHFAYKDNNGSVKQNHIVLNSHFDQINGQMNFVKPLPENTVPFEKLLPLLGISTES